MSYPGSAFTVPVTAVLQTTPPDSSIEEAYTSSATMFDLTMHGDQVVTVTLPSQPMKEAAVQLALAGLGLHPDSNGAECVILFLNKWDDGTETLASWETNSNRVPISSSTLETVLPPWAFYQLAGGLWEAKIMLAATTQHATPSLTSTAGRRLQGSGTCAGATLSRPLPTSNAVTSSFGIREHPVDGIVRHHYGVDLACQDGDEIRAAHNGMMTVYLVGVVDFNSAMHSAAGF